MSKIRFALLFLSFFAAAACQVSGEKTAQAAPSQNSEFEVSDRDRAFDGLVSGLNLESGAYQLEYKSSGTSIGFKIGQNGKGIAKFLPQNGAADRESQVVSFRLGQFLHMSRLVAPSRHFVLGPRTTAAFHEMVANANERNQWRQENREEILAALAKNPQSLAGVLTPKLETFEVEEMVLADQNTINSAHPVAQFVQANGPLPSPSRQMSFRNVKMKNGKVPTGSELDLAKQFSKIMVLDLLCGQWDRWSGGNLEVSYDSEGRMFFLARDNGGATMRGTDRVERQLRLVSRFDRNQLNRVARLVEILKSADGRRLAQDLELKSDPQALIQRAEALLSRVDRLVQQYGDNAVFFAE